MVQKKYLTNQIVKPFEVTVEAAFRRVDVLVTMMTQFPPTHAKGTQATALSYELFDDVKRLNDDEVRDIKFNLLPAKYQDKLESLEEDWSEMSNPKFLNEAQHLKTHLIMVF